MPRATEVIDGFPARYEGHWLTGARAKLGLARTEESDGALARDWLALLQAQAVDHTLAWRFLADAVDEEGFRLQALFDDTQPLMDATVYDIASRRLLFRAPGTSRVRASAAPVGLEAALREDRDEGLRLAADDLTKNLEAELAVFRERIKERPEEVKITHRPGYSGAGAFEGGAALVLAVVAGWAGRRRA